MSSEVTLSGQPTNIEIQLSGGTLAVENPEVPATAGTLWDAIEWVQDAIGSAFENDCSYPDSPSDPAPVWDHLLVAVDKILQVAKALW